MKKHFFQIGWTIGPKQLIRLCQVVHNNSIYCCPTFFQDVIARCFEHEIARFEKPDSYFKSITEELKPKRDRLAKLLVDIGLTPVIPEGGYFMLADISHLAKEFVTDEKEMKDSKFVKYLIKNKVCVLFQTVELEFIIIFVVLFQGLATIPSTAFYSDGHKKIAENYIRFCFFKAKNSYIYLFKI